MAERMVIDASVAANWFLTDESDTDLAEDILLGMLAGDIELHAPRIFTYEVCNLLAKACRHRSPDTGSPRMSKDQAIEAVRELFVLPIGLSEASEEEGVEALELSVDHSKLFYDMTYVRLAQRLDCRWCTKDDKVLKAVPPGFPADRIVLLSSLRDDGV